MKPIGTQILITPRLVLRPLKREDAQALVDIKSIPMADAQKMVAGK